MPIGISANGGVKFPYIPTIYLSADVLILVSTNVISVAGVPVYVEDNTSSLNIFGVPLISPKKSSINTNTPGENDDVKLPYPEFNSNTPEVIDVPTPYPNWPAVVLLPSACENCPIDFAPLPSACE